MSVNLKTSQIVLPFRSPTAWLSLLLLSLTLVRVSRLTGPHQTKADQFRLPLAVSLSIFR